MVGTILAASVGPAGDIQNAILVFGPIGGIVAFALLYWEATHRHRRHKTNVQARAEVGTGARSASGVTAPVAKPAKGGCGWVIAVIALILCIVLCCAAVGSQ
jgi:hypothetical protein